MNNEAVEILNAPVPPPEVQKDPMGGDNKDVSLPAKPQERVSNKLEVLIKREQAALFRERLAKQKEADVNARLQELQSREAKIQEFEGAKGNSKKALEMLGLNYDELSRSILKDGEIPPEVQIKKIEDKFEAFKAAKDQEDQRKIEDQKRHAEAQEVRAISDFKTEINTYLSDNSARYELIAFEGQQDLVFDVIDEHYTRTINPETGVGKVMSKSDAADKVEAYLEQKEVKRKELNKVKTLWGAVPKVTLQQAAKPQTNIRTPPKTLTNQLSATAKTTDPNRILTDEERVQKAIAYARGLRP